MALTLEQLNAADSATAVQLLDGLYGTFAMDCRASTGAAPLQVAAHLKYAMVQVLEKAGVQAQLELISRPPGTRWQGHGWPKTLTARIHERAKQGRACTACTPEELAHIQQLNAA